MTDGITFTFIEIVHDKIYMVIEKGHKPNWTRQMSGYVVNVKSYEIS